MLAPNQTLNPIPWIEKQDDDFYEANGVPRVISGNAKGFTEASVKIVYLAYQQTIEEEQLQLEEQILAQLNLEINLTFPASLENEALSDKPKEEFVEEEQTDINPPEIQTGESAIEPNDQKVELEGKK